ncbi:hypothetical protein HMPREF9176_1990 [Streptococcus downei F0415]|nr:hypothetical protein HMPREF9176_1990 [Streptococcus downei F0415]
MSLLHYRYLYSTIFQAVLTDFSENSLGKESPSLRHLPAAAL